MKAQRITDSISYHGEGPCWWPATGRLRFVDMLAGVGGGRAGGGAGGPPRRPGPAPGAATGVCPSPRAWRR